MQNTSSCWDQGSILATETGENSIYSRDGEGHLQDKSMGDTETYGGHRQMKHVFNYGPLDFMSQFFHINGIKKQEYMNLQNYISNKKYKKSTHMVVENYMYNKELISYTKNHRQVRKAGSSWGVLPGKSTPIVHPVSKGQPLKYAYK